MTLVLLPLIFAVLNRARGSHFWDYFASTVESRLLATFGMALVTAYVTTHDFRTADCVLLWSWLTLLLWCSPAWDCYWSAAIGNATDLTAPACAPVDWLMRRLPITNPRLWGAVAMGLRQAFAAPFLIGVAVAAGKPLHALYALATLLFGCLYYTTGTLWPRAPRAVAVAEYAVGAALGLIVYLIAC